MQIYSFIGLLSTAAAFVSLLMGFNEVPDTPNDAMLRYANQEGYGMKVFALSEVQNQLSEYNSKLHLKLRIRKSLAIVVFLLAITVAALQMLG